ncbi:MAG: phosphatidate cytidylyltransferase [Bacteroidota bacterium]
MKNFTQRAITAMVFAATVVTLLLFGPWTFLIFSLLVLIPGILEFYRLMRSEGVSPQTWMGLVLGISLLGMVIGVVMGFFSYDSLLLLLPMVFSIFILELYRKAQHPFLNIAVTLMGVLYLALPVSMMAVIAFVPGISNGEYHGGLVLGCIFHVWASDTGAYLIGSKFGRNKLFERISPNKSWEGFFGGLVCSAAVAWANHALFGILELDQWIIVSIIIVVTGTLGDLVESLLKRSIHIKDSGNFFPGHGGILDRFDAVLVSMPFVCTYLWLVGRFG